MKNSSKKRIPGKNNREYNKNLDFGYHPKNKNRSEKSDRSLNNFTKNKNVETLNKNDKNNTFSSLKTNKSIYKSNKEFPNKNPDINQVFINKKNFDDWIWGKHSVYEALISERSINRIWCTSEIFSSDKFYILF